MANSNSVNVKVLGYRKAWWKMALIGADAAAVIALAVWGVVKISKAKKMKKAA